MLVALCVATLFSNASAQTGATLLAGWDFQTANATTGAASIVISPNTPTILPSNFGTGYIFLDGTNGSSLFLPSYGEISGTTGVNYNTTTGDGFSTVVTSPAALLIARKTIVSPASDTNGKSIVFKFSMTGYNFVNISYGLLRHGTATDSTSFTKTTWSYSLDGSTWTKIEDVDIFPLYHAVNSSGARTYYGSKLYTIPSNSTYLPQLANAATAYLKMTVDGATGTTSYSNIRLDNFKIKAFLEDPTAINVVNVSRHAIVKASKSGISIKSDNKSEYEIFNNTGLLISKGIVETNETQIPISTKGLLMVKVNSEVTKVVR